MVKRVSTGNRRKFKVRRRTIKRRVNENKKVDAQTQAVLGRPPATPAGPSGESERTG